MFFTATKKQLQEGVGNEVKEYFKELGISQNQVARTINMAPQLLGRYLSGKAGFGKKVAQRLQDAYGLNAEFLITGFGPLLLVDAQKEDDEQREREREFKAQFNLLIREFGPDNVLYLLSVHLLENRNSCTTISYKDESILLGRTSDPKAPEYFKKWWLRGLR